MMRFRLHNFWCVRIAISFLKACYKSFDLMKSPSVTYYKNAQPTDIELTVPEKVRGKYFSYLSSKQSPLFLQTPTLNIYPTDNNTIRLKTKPDGQFSQLLKGFDKFIIDYITERSVQFFRGYVFTKSKIESSYISSVDDEGFIEVHITNSDKLLIKDQRDRTCDYKDLSEGIEAIAILDFEGVSFTKRTIKLSLTLHQLKIYVKEELPDWSILNDSDSEGEEDPDPVDAEELARALELATEEKVLPEKVVIEQPTEEDKEHKEIDKVPHNDDEKDLF